MHTDQRNSQAQLPLIPSRQLIRHPSRKRCKTYSFHQRLHILLYIIDASDTGVESEVFENSHLIEGIVLRAYSEM